MTKSHPKYKLLLDEGFFVRTKLISLNGYHNVTHVTEYKSRAKYKKVDRILDPEVHKIACKEKRLIITFNDRDFYKLKDLSSNTGIISVSQNMLNDDIDKKILKLLIVKPRKELYGNFNRITQGTKL